MLSWPKPLQSFSCLLCILAFVHFYHMKIIPVYFCFFLTGNRFTIYLFFQQNNRKFSYNPQLIDLTSENLSVPQQQPRHVRPPHPHHSSAFHQVSAPGHLHDSHG